MTIKYATLLAATKFRTRLGRSIVTVIAASLVASIMLIASFIIAGFSSSIQGISQTPISRLNVAQENIFIRGERGGTKSVTATPTAPAAALTLDQYKTSIAKYNPQTVYEDESLGSFTLTSPVLPTVGGQAVTQSVSTRSDVLYTDSLDTTTPATVVPGTIPAAISSDLVLELSNITFSDTDTSSFKVSQTLAAENTWRGKTLTMTGTDGNGQTETVKVTIQGFLPAGGLFGEGVTNTIIMPVGAATTALKNIPAPTQSNITFYASFASQSDLLSFVQNEQSSRGTTGTFHSVSVYGNPLLQLQEIEAQVTTILKYIIIVLLIAVALAILTTLSKIIADSERETGVFRAIGARVRDIFQIYISYSVLISIVAMLVALLVSSGVSAFLSSRYSDNLTYELLTLSGSSNLTTHVSLFGVNWLDIGGIFLAILVAGLVGALVPLIGLLRKDPIKALRAE